MNETKISIKIEQAMDVLNKIGMPKAQQNERTALCLLALLSLSPEKAWTNVEAPMIGITPIMDWVAANYDKKYAPNTRETFRRQSMHQLVSAGFVNYNPDEPDRPVNSPKAVYQVESGFLELVKSYGAQDWESKLSKYMEGIESLVERYKRRREQVKVPVNINSEQLIHLSPGDHSELIRDIIEEFAPRFAKGCEVVYIGDTGAKTSYFQKEIFQAIEVELDSHGKLPDVVLFDKDKSWLYLIESVTSHGPVDNKRYDELNDLFGDAKADLIYVTALPSRELFTRFIADIAWETEVWIAEDPSHMIHFNGDKFMGPHVAEKVQ